MQKAKYKGIIFNSDWNTFESEMGTISNFSMETGINWDYTRTAALNQHLCCVSHRDLVPPRIKEKPNSNYNEMPSYTCQNGYHQ